MTLNPLLLSRILFGVTSAFHILWPMLSIGMSLYMFLLELAYVRTGDVKYYRQVRFWAKIFLLTFGIGVASGIPLEFEFGTNWAAFSKSAGDFFGNVLGFEATMAFALEAAFLGIFVFGWKRVSAKLHLFSNFMVFVGATLSLFWIMSANSWMQTPAGVVMQGGTVVVTNYFAAVFNPDALVSSVHMWLACIETTVFFMASICAYHLRRRETTKKRAAFFMTAFTWLLLIAVVATPLQIVAGDASARTVSALQPEKAAAMELHWTTNTPGTGAPWAIVAWPNRNDSGNAFEVDVPYALSILTNHTLTAQVPGLATFPRDDRPPQAVIFYSFRVMVLIGMLMVLLMLWGVVLWRRGALRAGQQGKHRMFWTVMFYSWPLGFLATELGWMVREIGRQPWILYHMMRTSEGVSPNLNGTTALALLLIFTTLYVAALVLFVYFTARIVRRGPDFDDVPPQAVSPRAKVRRG